MTALYKHISRFVPLTEQDFMGILAHFESIEVGKKQNLVAEGQLCTYNYFVVKGCLRLFFTDEKGVEQTMQFALEDWWMTDLDAFVKGQRSHFTIQAIEKTEVLAIDKKSMDAMLETWPVMEKYFRLIYQRAYAASLFRIKYITRLSKDEFYDLFINAYPEFAQRIPQKILASFLGFTPEYLSELRRKRLS
ncbi:CRP-like cAMP-binding protein [Filimonas zeae]|uniref:Cyclic nucleotide-binding domain-containing protein n=1 Tax=Filimonas zeae TaxID=1737353 RepID=A0A917ILS1_9BACT|nr:Crp/Fnr family transcriptional regulator [Filimonas zeae]MDR6337091.1 CRP-like cAMP-binding protein [Filimonas zeae]GGH56952.1 hypothetical protein GCM10011379_01110 [Filimonas zeae]